jgi:predicted extracellular nuclease
MSLPTRFPVQKIIFASLLLAFTHFNALDNFILVHNQDSVPKQRAICQVQGSGFTSPYIDQEITLHGVVYADFDQKRYGFFMQDKNCDFDPGTSDGIFVYLGGNHQVVNSGDLIEVTGKISEYYGNTELIATPLSVTVISSGNTLPNPIDLKPPLKNDRSDLYFEAREGMYVSLQEGTVVGPTNESGESWLVRSDLEIEHVFQDDRSGTGEIICVDEDGLYKIDPQVKVGDQVTGLVGALNYVAGNYCMHLTSEPQVLVRSTSSPATFTQLGNLNPPLSIATFNLENLFDTVDDINKEDIVLTAAEYNRRLTKLALVISNVLGEPDLLGVEEVETNIILHNLIDQPLIAAPYGVVWMDTPDLRGLDVALLYRTDRIKIIDYFQHQGCTTLIDGFGPDGNNDPINPINAITCDSNHDGLLDGNRLFSRPPLLVQVSLKANPLISQGTQTTSDIYLIINHWKSKVEDTSTVEYTLPRRLEEAAFVLDMVFEILDQSPTANIMVMGDLNDYPSSAALELLQESGLNNAIQLLSKDQRYTYNYHGVSQVLDYILYRLSGDSQPSQVIAHPINSDYPIDSSLNAESAFRSSDHDPFQIMITSFPSYIYLPVITK